MSTPAPVLNLPKQPPAIVIGAMRSITPWIVLWLTGLLAKANVHLDNQWLTNAVEARLHNRPAPTLSVES